MVKAVRRQYSSDVQEYMEGPGMPHQPEVLRRNPLLLCPRTSYILVRTQLHQNWPTVKSKFTHIAHRRRSLDPGSDMGAQRGVPARGSLRSVDCGSEAQKSGGGDCIEILERHYRIA